MENSPVTEEFVKQMMNYPKFIILAGRGISKSEHTYWNSLLSKPTMWNMLMAVAARQSVHDVYRFPETFDQYNYPGVVRLVLLLKQRGIPHNIITDIQDGFFERIGVAPETLINLCGSVEEMYAYSQQKNPPSNWTSLLSTGVISERMERARTLLSSSDTRSTFIVSVGIHNNSNFGLLEGLLLQFPSLGIDKAGTRGQPICQTEIHNENVDEVTEGLCACIYTALNV